MQASLTLRQPGVMMIEEFMMDKTPAAFSLREFCSYATIRKEFRFLKTISSLEWK